MEGGEGGSDILLNNMCYVTTLCDNLLYFLNTW